MRVKAPLIPSQPQPPAEPRPLHRTTPLAASITGVAGYPSKLVIYQLRASRFWWVRYYAHGKILRKSTKAEQKAPALAFAKLMKGDTAGARSDFVVIGATLDAPDTARQRANAAVNLIDSGSAKMVPAAVKAALAAPPPALVAPGGMPVLPSLPDQAPPKQ